MDATLQDPLVGRVLDGRYCIQSRIARGGMATVYVALDDRLDREVALKVMHGHLAEDPEFVARFVREARSAARLSHPNVVQVFDQGADHGVLYLAMEHLPGRTLREVLIERGVLTPREALSVIDPVLDALAAAHQAGIVHRDMKPENVLLTDDGRIKVADFGLARAATSTATTGTLIGTVAYLSPELVARGIADARSDVYACGIMLFEMLTGTAPFTGDVPIQVAFQHVHEQVPAPSELVPELPEELDDVVLAATARDADERPADAGAMLLQIRAARAGLAADVLDHRPRAGRRAGVAGWNGSGSNGTGARTAATAAAGSAELRQTQALPGAGKTAPGKSIDLRSPGRDEDVAEADGPAEPDLGDAVASSGKLMARRRRRGTLLLTFVLALALTLGAGAWWWVAGPGAFTTTPEVNGVPAAQAVATLQAHKIGYTEQRVFDDAVAPGLVVDTQPAGGARVRRDGRVTIEVSKGPQMFAVPALAGTTPDVAKQALLKANLALGATTQAYNGSVPSGQIVSSAPAPGAQLKRGTPVSVVVSKGPQPVAVPALVGKSQADAQAAISKAGLQVTATTQQSDTVGKGLVSAQSPASGTLLPGQRVSIVVSTGPPLVQVPNVFKMSYAEARKVLQKAGFTVQRQGLRILNEVWETNPPAGSMAPKGSVIIVKTF